MKKILLHIGVFVGTLLFLWLLLFLSVLIPNDKIKDNMIESAYYYSDRQPYQFQEDGKFNGVEDNYADAILLGVLWNMDSDDALVSSLDTKYYDGDERGENYGLYAAINGHESNVDYTRYWHGSVTFIRPLLMFTTVDNIEWISFGAFVVLLLVVCGILIKKKCAAVAGLLVVSLACVHIWNIRLSLEYMPSFVVAMLMSILFLLLEKNDVKPKYAKQICDEKKDTNIKSILQKDNRLTMLSVVSGVMVSFYDFLTTETVAILIPLALVFMVREKEKRLGNTKENILLTVKCGVAWGISYVTCFAVKWIAASAATGENKILASFSSATERFNGVEEGENITAFQEFLYAIPANLSTVFGGTSRVTAGNIVGGIIVFGIIVGSVFYLFSSKKKNKEIALILLIIGLIPYVRYAILNNHSYLHEFFTYRAQCVSVFGILGMIYFNSIFYLGKDNQVNKKKNNPGKRRKR